MSPELRRAWTAWLPAFAYMALIWLLSSLTFDAPVEYFPWRDKGVHFVEYGVLGFLLAHACLATWPRHQVWRTAALAVLITFLWGWLDEIHQAFVPGRASDALDLVADTAGALVGAGARSAVQLVRGRFARTAE